MRPRRSSYGVVAVFAIGVSAPIAGCSREPASTEAAPSAEPPRRRGDLDVVVTGDGVVWYAGNPILDDATIRARAESFHARRPHGGAHIRCEPAALHGRLVRVLDLLREAGIPQTSVEMM